MEKSFNIEGKYEGSPRDDNLETNGSSGERTRAEELELRNSND